MTDDIKLLPLPEGNVAHLIAGQDAEIKALRAEVDALRKALREARSAALDEAIKVIEEYRIPVGNSVAGELACEWTRDALMDIRDTILTLKGKNDEYK